MGGTAELMAQFPSNIGILPAGKTITICYEVSINANTPANVTEVCEQGSITYDDPNMPGQTLSFKTDDPSVNVVVEDPTCTNVQVCDISQATCPTDITVDNDAGLCGANVVLPDPSIPTECTSATFSYSPASGSFFPIGTTQVTATISDGLGNQTVCTLNVTVNDTENPTIICPADIVIDNDAGQCGAIVNIPAPTINDNCPGSTFSYSPASGSSFPIGTTVVDAIVTDASGNQAMCSFNVTVNDTENPTIICPADIVVDNDAGLCGATVNIPNPTINDNCPGTSFSYSPTSGSFFSVGTTVVGATVTDASGNQAQCFFEVTVNDTEAPVLSCQSLTFCKIPGQNINIVPVDIIASLSDNCSDPADISKTLSQSAFTDADLGANNVTLTVTDEAGQVANCNTVVNLAGFASVTAGAQTACDPWFNTYSQELQISYVTPPGYTGDIIVNGIVFDDTGSPLTVTLVDLPANGQNVDVTVAFEGAFDCTQTFDDVFTSPASCAVPCDIIDVVAGSESGCDAFTRTYQQELLIFYEGTNLTGNILVSLDGGSYIPYPIEFQSPQSINVEVPIDGKFHDINVKFSDQPGCSFRGRKLFKAIQNCGCDITGVSLNSQPVCNSNNNGKYDVCLFFDGTAFNDDSDADLRINGDPVFYTTQEVPGGVIVCIEDLPADGLPVDVWVEAFDGCVFQQNNLFTAPDDCLDAACVINDLMFNDATCDNIDGTFDLSLEVQYSTPPSTGTLDVQIQNNTYSFVITGSPQTLVISGLDANGQSTDVTVEFSDLTSCFMTVDDLFTAPTCSQNDPCEILNFEVDEIQCNVNGTYRVCFNIFGTNLPVVLGPDAVIKIGNQTYPEDLYQLQPGGALLCVDALPADNRRKNVSIQLEDGCEKTIRRLYRAPSSCGNTRTADLNLIGPNIVVFPNPSTGEIHVSSSFGLKGDIQVFNSLGQMIAEKRLENEMEARLNLEDQPEGLYTVRISSEGFVETKKVQIER